MLDKETGNKLSKADILKFLTRGIKPVVRDVPPRPPEPAGEDDLGEMTDFELRRETLTPGDYKEE